jgi:hypothetical protein
LLEAYDDEDYWDALDERSGDRLRQLHYHRSDANLRRLTAVLERIADHLQLIGDVLSEMIPDDPRMRR